MKLIDDNVEHIDMEDTDQIGRKKIVNDSDALALLNLFKTMSFDEQIEFMSNFLLMMNLNEKLMAEHNCLKEYIEKIPH